MKIIIQDITREEFETKYGPTPKKLMSIDELMEKVHKEGNRTVIPYEKIKSPVLKT